MSGEVNVTWEGIRLSDGSQYDADYFLRGEDTGKSLYTDYRWMPDLTIPMVEAMIDYLGIRKGHRILDFGCARGYTVKAFRLLGYDAWGMDVSEWAIENADEETKPYLTLSAGVSAVPPLKSEEYDWVIAKDVLEHVHLVTYTIQTLMRATTQGVFAVVPLSQFNNGKYVVDDYERDVTHCQRHPLYKWVEMFLYPGWRVEAAYRVPGVKDNYYKPGWERGNGFITARRIEE